ncbi:hypothetical protein CDES_02600 [Corynebacterium deserti GIMN1.010]|uniref:SIMPL domain-containing protein n=1 Tax=Corynebacterium deserti GIMN1.010 TaxID=931089 RepID=A0A0M4CVF6_9CORY|nr:SIMPL domain-containing protein [Corynebacterium deserti]ALC04975.1 hypothetical protein CDES_02600 [Corynebacterium deserti GIMN1.010]
MTPKINVDANAHVYVPADVWVLVIEIECTHSYPAKAYEKRAAAIAEAKRVVGDIEILNEHINEWTHRGETSAEWSCRIEGTLGNHDQLKRIASTLAAIPDIKSTGPTWYVSAEGHRQGRDRAIKDAVALARHEAEILAQAAGGSLRNVTTIHLDRDYENNRAPRQNTMSELIVEVSGAPELDLNASDVSVSASVILEYEFIEG